MVVVRAVVLAFALTLILSTPASGAFEDWAYEGAVEVKAANRDRILTNHWVPIEDVHARALHSQDFMRSDAGDLRMATSLGEELPIFAQGLNSDRTTWWFRAPSVSEDPTTYFMHLGRPSETRDQGFGLSEDDMLSIADSADLEPGDNRGIVVESMGTRVDALPAGTGWLLRKPGAYGLGIRPSGKDLEVFGEIVTGASTSVDTEHTAVALPSYDSSTLSPRVETEGCDDTAKHDCIDDPGGNPDTDTYLHTSDNSMTTTHAATALPDGDGDISSARIVENGCQGTDKWRCVNDAANSPDTSTFLSTVDLNTDIDETQNMLPDSNGDRTSANVVALGCPSGSKWQCVNDAVGSADDATSYLYSQGIVTEDSPNLLPDSAGDETSAGVRSVGCPFGSKWQCVDDPIVLPDTNTYLYTSGVTTSGFGTMRPNGQATTSSAISKSSGCTDSDNYQCIDEEVADDNDYLWAGSDGGTERYHLTNLSVPSNASITYIRATVRYRGGASDLTRCSVLVHLRTGSQLTSFKGITDSNVLGSWYNTGGSWTTEPDGSTWDLSDLPGLQVGLTLDYTRSGSGTCRASQVYVTVRYTLSVSNVVKTETFNVEAPPTIPAGATISHVTTRFRYSDNMTTGTCEISTKLRLNGVDLEDVASVNANPTTWTNVTGSATAKPGGGPWAATDLANLQVGLSMRTLGGNASNRCLVTQLYVTVHYSGAPIPVNKVSFGLSSPSGIPGGATISEITTHFRYVDDTLPSGTCEISTALRIGGTEHATPVASVNANPTTWTSVTGASWAKPDGNAWTPADLANVQIVLSMRTLGGNANSQCRVTQVYAVVDYSENTDSAIHEISFTIGNPTIPSNASITSVSTRFRYNHAGAESGSCRIWSTLRLRGNALNAVANVSARPATWTDVDGAATTKPGGGVWVRTDIPDLEVGLRMRTIGSGMCQVTQVYAVVNYSVTTLDTAVHSIRFGLSVPAIPADARVDKVTTRFRYIGTGSNSGSCNINSTLHLGGNTLNPVPYASARPTTWTDVDGETTIKPGGGSWTTGDLGVLEIGLRMRTIGRELSCRVTQLNATIHYTITTVAAATTQTAATTQSVSHSPLAVGTTYDIEFLHDTAELSLWIDGSQVATHNGAPTIRDTDEDMVIGGGWTGEVKRTRFATSFRDASEYRDQSGEADHLRAAFSGGGTQARHSGDFQVFDQYLDFEPSRGSFNTAASTSAMENLFAGGGTIEFCALAPSGGQNGERGVISKTAWGVLYIANDGGQFRFRHGFSGSSAEWSYPGSLTQDGNWHCYAASYDRDQTMSSAAFYIDGQPVTASVANARSGSPNDDTGDNFQVGNVTLQDYDGALDEIRLWNDIRTPEEIAANWNTPIADPSSAEGLVGYWPMDDSTETTLRLDLQYEPTHTTETQKGTVYNTWNWLGVVTDQSIYGHDAAYSLLRDGSDTDVLKGGLAIKNVTEDVVVSIPNPQGVVQPIVGGDIGTGTNRAPNVPIIGLLVSVFADVAEIDYSLVWTTLLLLLAVVALTGIVKVTGEPITGVFAAGLVLTFGAMIDVVSWLVLIIYVILSVSLGAILVRRP